MRDCDILRSNVISCASKTDNAGEDDFVREILGAGVELAFGEAENAREDDLIQVILDESVDATKLIGDVLQLILVERIDVGERWNLREFSLGK